VRKGIGTLFGADVSGSRHTCYMTDLAYMVREDWAQQGTAMVSSSARIREWLGDGPMVFAVTDKRKFNGANMQNELSTLSIMIDGAFA
jgi:hypothetical protein